MIFVFSIQELDRDEARQTEIEEATICIGQVKGVERVDHVTISIVRCNVTG